MSPTLSVRRALYRGLVNYLVTPASTAPVSATPVRPPREHLQPLLMPGDVILVSGRTRFSALIRRLTRSAWSHVAIYVGPGHHEDASHCVVEADVEAGVRLIPLEGLGDNEILVVRASQLPDAAREELVHYLLARVGHPYDLNHIVGMARLILFAPLPLGRLLSPRTMRAADPTRTICSTLIAHAFFTAGVSIGISPAVAARLQQAAREYDSGTAEALDYLVPGDFERLPEFVTVFDSRLA
jgi:cell wall-associated NlpC family hydrolase